MNKYKIFLTGFLLGIIFTMMMVIINYLLNNENEQAKNKYSDSHLICTQSPNDLNTLICKISANAKGDAHDSNKTKY